MQSFCTSSPRIRRHLASLLLASLAGAAALADPVPASAQPAADNPYRAIVARNAFRLKDPLPPPEPAPPPPVVQEVPKTDVKLAGLAEIGGVRYAYLMVPDADRPGQFEYPALTDDPTRSGGVRHRSGLEIKEIDLKNQSVRLVNGGIEATLNLKEHGVKAAPVATAAKPGANTPGQNVNVRRPTVVVNPTATSDQAANATSTEPLIFSRRNRGSDAGNVISDNAGTANANATVRQWDATSGGGVGSPVLPSRPVRTDVANQPQNTPVRENQPAIPIEQQYETLIRQRLAADTAGIPLPPIPGLPTPNPAPPQE